MYLFSNFNIVIMWQSMTVNIILKKYAILNFGNFNI